jgi:hypothetical protein
VHFFFENYGGEKDQVDGNAEKNMKSKSEYLSPIVASIMTINNIIPIGIRLNLYNP